MDTRVITRTEHRVHHVCDLTPSAYVLRFERRGLEFQPVQYVFVGLAGKLDMREYTVYSSPHEDYLEILVKEIECSYPGLHYRVLHGVRQAGELYGREAFDRRRFTACVSRGDGGDYRGRVTGYLREHPADPESLCYLCGSCDMIYEAFDILTNQGVPHDHFFTEVYY